MSLSSNSYNSQSLSLFSSPEMSASAAITIGDIFGALFIGCVAYFSIVVPFLVGVFSLSSHFFKNQQGGGNDNLSGMGLVLFILKPLLYLFSGLFVFALFSLFLNTSFKINMASWVKFFFEARYNTLLGNISASGQTKEASQWMLGILDMVSTGMFWSIPVIYFILYATVAAYTLSIFIENGNSDVSMVKKIFVSFFVGAISVGIITIYTSSINRSFFKGGLTIENLGEVYSIENTNITLVKREIKRVIGEY